MKRFPYYPGHHYENRRTGIRCQLLYHNPFEEFVVVQFPRGIKARRIRCRDFEKFWALKAAT